MNWWREVSLIIIGCWAVVAAANDRANARNIGEQDVKFLVKPLDIFYGKKPTSKPSAVVLKPVYPAYPYPYPIYPYPTQPIFAPTPTTTRRPKQPKPLKQKPIYGYYPIYNLPQAKPTLAPNRRPPILLVYGPRSQYANWHEENFSHDNRINAKNAASPLAENEQILETVDDNLTEFQNQESEHETDDPSNDASSINESEEESDALAIDTDHINLPFGIQLSGPKTPTADKSNKKLKQQEALIYLRNYKKGRNLEEIY